MGVPAVWQDGTIGAWALAGQRYHLTNGAGTGTGVAFHAFRVRKSIPSVDVTTYSTSSVVSARKLAQLYTWEADLEGLWPRGGAKLGTSGNVSFGSAVSPASPYATNVLRWNLNIENEVHEWTPFTGAAGVVTPYFRPGRGMWSGSYTALVDLTTSITGGSFPGDDGSAGHGTLTLKLLEDTNDPSFTGQIVVTSVDVGAQRGSLTEVTYNFDGSGDLTVVAGSTVSNILPAGNAFPTEWDADGNGIPDGTLTLTAASGKTYSGPAFIRSIGITCEPGSPIAVSVTAQGAGTLTIA